MKKNYILLILISLLFISGCASTGRKERTIERENRFHQKMERIFDALP